MLCFNICLLFSANIFLLEMDKKQHFNLENSKDVEYLLNYITDDMVENSETEGDEDAGDPLPVPENTSRRFQEIL
jgi:hypothetical protein